MHNYNSSNNNANVNNGSNKVQYQTVIEQDFDTADCIRFINCVRKTLTMFSIENKFIYKIIDGSKDRIMACKILDRIFDPVLRFLSNDAEVIIDLAFLSLFPNVI